MRYTLRKVRFKSYLEVDSIAKPEIIILTDDAIYQSHSRTW